MQRDNPFETRLSDKLTNFVSNIVAFFVPQKIVKAIPTFISIANKTCVAFTYENNPMTSLVEKSLGYFFFCLHKSIDYKITFLTFIKIYILTKHVRNFIFHFY